MSKDRKGASYRETQEGHKRKEEGREDMRIVPRIY